MVKKMNNMEQEMTNMMIEVANVKGFQARAERDQQETVTLRERVAVLESQIHGGNFPPNQAEQQSTNTGSVLNPQADDVSVVDSELLSKNDSVGGLLRRRKRDAPTPNWVRLPIGPSGCQSGRDGRDGIPGAAGLPGTAGQKGETGPPGPKGEPGTGTSNEQGLKGQKGDMGSIGGQGPEGPKGDRGSTGPQGFKGMKGARGSTGQQGAKGASGSTGLQGAKGDRGSTGQQGAKGDRGFTGLQGAKGMKGDMGSTGLQGARGDRGYTGLQGARGAMGPTGPQGAKGQKGYRGYTGSTGPKGPGGAVYIRWAKKTCPSGATTVYSGVAGGAYWNHPGSGTNYQCLPTNPQWRRYQDGIQGWKAFIYGSEYELNTNVPFGSTSLHNHNIPCAVCYVPTRGSKLMIPARYTCPTAWTEEYDGYLMAGKFDHAGAKQYVCVDEQPDTVQGGHANQAGALFYSVEARCGSLPCPDYVEGRELTCVVCTK
ncbi:short-chain collagen C4-like [Branchiostoma floridae]|uniref:Short-chain collagen C4-like n=1 Tax=Branchiostoma floridae TaxID=7739 RepID=A0A9J7N1G6_BRAFL|nr:short-chain collagen C4-like [Branchiostoma floridae]